MTDLTDSLHLQLTNTTQRKARFAPLLFSTLATLVLAGCGTAAMTPIEASRIKPVAVAYIAPVSKSVQARIDFTPGIAGLAQNIVNAVSTVKQGTSDKIRVMTLYPTKPVFEKGDSCAGHFSDVALTEQLSIIKPGDLVRIKEDASGETIVERVFLADGTASTIQEDDFCYPVYSKFISDLKKKMEENEARIKRLSNRQE